MNLVAQIRHNECPTPIVHCDLKPSNVLLDDNMIAHLSDFGLAKFLPTIASGSSQSETSSIGVRGTIGYTAPGNYTSIFIFRKFINIKYKSWDIDDVKKVLKT